MVGRKRPAAASPLARARAICLAFPGAHEVTAWGAPTFRVKNKLFAMYASAENHHGGGRPALWCKVGPGNKELLIAADEQRYFSPPYVGPSGWVGIWLDRRPRWSAVRELAAEGYQLTAPRPGSRTSNPRGTAPPRRRTRSD